jgi:hypothetical protein
MIPRLVRSASSLLLVLLAAGSAAAAESARDALRPINRPPPRETIQPARPAPAPTPAQRPQATRPGQKGILPDPVILDGSKHPPEKRSEYGMLGEFEMPGDENAPQDGRAGGQQSEQMAGGGGGQQQEEEQGGQMPEQQLGGGPQLAQQDQQQDAQQQQQGGGGNGVQQIEAAGGGAAPIEGAGDPNAQPQGMQVAQLQTDPEAGNSGEANASQRPGQVGIGDSAMQIKPIGNAPNVVGTQQAGQTQQHEKQTGSSGRPPAGNNSNRGVERGRTMPAGL